MAKNAPTKRVDIGLDLTSNELRCVALTRRGKEITLERFAIGEIPSSVFAAGRVAEPVELGTRIRGILNENGIIPRRAIVSLSGKAAITRVIELPKMGAAQTRQAISLQINQYVPFPPGDTVYDYKVLPPREGGNPSMQEVLLVATRATTVDSLIATLRAGGIEADGIKITSLAAWNLLEPSLVGYTQAVGVIDIRDTVTDLSFFLNGHFRLSRPVELGYLNIMAKVAQLLGVTPTEAEEYLKAEPVDLTIPEDEIDPTEDNRMREALLSVFSGFISELIRSIRYYESQAQRSERVGKLLLFGSTRMFPNLAKYLEDQTGLEIFEVSLSSFIQYRQGVYSLDFLNENSSRLPVAAGLALEHFKPKKSLNLMPPTYYTRNINWVIVRVAVVLFLACALLGYTYYQKRVQELAVVQNDLSQKTAEANKLEPAATEFDTVKSEIQSQMPRYNQVFGLFKSQFPWPEIMKELGNRINERVWLDAVDFEGGTKKITIKGIGVDRADVMQFAIDIDKSPFFTNTALTEKTENNSGTGGGGGGGGGGGAAVAASGASSAPSPIRPGLNGRQNFTKPQQDYKLPRFDFRPGASIEDFFRQDYEVFYQIVWKFEITTDLQKDIINQYDALVDIVKIDEVIGDVLKT